MINIKRDVVFILGNGFSIDLIQQLDMQNQIDLTNLFRNGDRVPWPANDKPGFLSQTYCPELWKLGARPNSDGIVAGKLIDDIITCANVSATFVSPTINSESPNVYIRAYHELVTYLKYLFIYYNGVVKKEKLEEIVDRWGWSKLFKNLYANSNISSVSFITYNYDIFLERLLTVLGIEFKMVGFDNKDCKFRIIKPHGSISFRSKKMYDKETFSIKYNRDSLGGGLDMLEVDEDVNFSKISNINTMIPPSGESQRYNSVWSKALRDEAIACIKKCQEEDDIFFGGLSYCGVDRQEIDSLITSMNNGVNIHVVNPDTNSTFGAVVSSVFDKYVHYTDSEIIGGLYND